MNVGVGGGPAQARTEWLPDPPADGSNFRSRGAGLSCRPARQGPKSVPRKPPRSHMFKARCRACLCLFKDAGARSLARLLGDSLSEDGAEADAFRALLGGGPAAVITPLACHHASCVPCLFLAWGRGWAAGPRGSPWAHLGARPNSAE